MIARTDVSVLPLSRGVLLVEANRLVSLVVSLGGLLSGTKPDDCKVHGFYQGNQNVT